MRLALLHPFLILAVLTSSAQAREHELVNNFASKGLFFTLKQCNLPKTCGGKPFIAEKKIKRETSNDDYVDQRSLKFDGLEIELWYVLKDSPGKPVKNPYSKPEILEVTITKSFWPVAHGLNVGVSKEKVVRVLGEGLKQERDCLDYVNVEKQDGVTFCFRGNKVEKIHWVLWNDR